MSEEALAIIRRCSSLNGARQAARSRPQFRLVDLYHRGQGHRFTIGSADLATLVRRGLQVTRAEQSALVDAGEDDSEVQAMIQCGVALLTWLE